VLPLAAYHEEAPLEAKVVPLPRNDQDRLPESVASPWADHVLLPWATAEVVTPEESVESSLSNPPLAEVEELVDHAAEEVLVVVAKLLPLVLLTFAALPLCEPLVGVQVLPSPDSDQFTDSDSPTDTEPLEEVAPELEALTLRVETLVAFEVVVAAELSSR